MDTRTALERLTIRPITGTSSQALNFHVYYENYYHGSIHKYSSGWFWSSHTREDGPYNSAEETIAAVKAYYAGLDITP